MTLSYSEKVPEVRLWKISNNILSEIEKSKLDFEERLENWIESDVSIIAPNLLVVGRQVETDYGGIIDLLCIDENGNIVIIELKRDKTPRDITAQVIDYSSWLDSFELVLINIFLNQFLYGNQPIHRYHIFRHYLPYRNLLQSLLLQDSLIISQS